MNPAVQKFGPPFFVFGIALYLGWPASAPMDFGDDVVKAKSVRWKTADLRSPEPLDRVVDPFVAVLVAGGEMEVEPDTGKLVVPTTPSGPSLAVIQNGLQVSGIAVMGRNRWAVMNGRPRLVGDTLATSDADRHKCTVIAIESDHVVVRCQEQTYQVRQTRAKQQPTVSADGANAADGPTETPIQQSRDNESDAEASDSNVPPPPAVN